MKLLKWLFKTKPTKPVLNDEPKYAGFDIEHLPHAGRYFPRYNGKYLFWWHTRQNYSTENSISGCQYASSKEGALKIIDEYLELRGVGSKIIKL